MAGSVIASGTGCDLCILGRAEGFQQSIRHRLLFDPGHGLEERLIREQFV